MFRWIVCGVLALGASGCFSNRVVVKDAFSWGTEATPTAVAMETTSGDLSVRGRSAPGVSLTGMFEVRAGDGVRARSLAEALKAQPPVRLQDGKLSLGALEHLELRSDESVSVALDVHVPEATRVTFEATSGDLHVSGVDGPVKATCTSGGVVVDGVGSDVSVEVTSGDVQLAHVRGDVRIEATSGDVSLRDVSGNVTVEASSADVEIQSGMGAASAWQVNVSSGDVTLQVPVDASFTFEASTTSGAIQTDFPLLSGRSAAGDVQGVVGNAPNTRSIQVNASSGDVRLKAGPSAAAHTPRM